MTIFIVEGQTEKRFLQNVCPKSRILIVPNGKTVCPDAFGRRAGALLRSQKACDVDHIVVLDREGRRGSSAEIAGRVSKRIIEAGIKAERVFVGCPDKMIENWMLADPDAIAKHLGINATPYEFEGRGGKTAVKKIFSSAGKVYRETLDGVAILRRCRPDVMSTHSQSAQEFFSAIGVECWWTEAGRLSV